MKMDQNGSLAENASMHVCVRREFDGPVARQWFTANMMQV
jgi:hypothetical protein